FDPFEVTPAHLIYVGLGFFIVIFGMLSLFIKERLYLGEAPIAAAFGIIVGPLAINLFNPAGWGGENGETPGGNITNEVTLEVMRVTIALSVFAVGVELPKKYLLRHWQSIAMLLGPVMIWGWMVTSLFIYALIPGLDFLNSMVVAACVTPTDPILAQAVVGGPWAEKHVPAHLRHMLMCESGCNDGAAFPFLYLALYLTQNRDNRGKAIAEWFYDTWAYEIILGTLLGALIGYAARKFMRFSERHKLVDRESFVAQYVSLAIASMGVNVLLGSDDLLAAFACGTAFAWDGWFTKQTEDSNFSNIVDLLFNVATFIYIGALMPWHDFANADISLSVWRLIVLTILVLLLKRIPIILALWKWIPDIKTFREAVFSGHFGPMGVGAIFIATLGRTLMPEEIPEPPVTSNDVLALTIQPIVFFFVLCSIIVHGLTVPFFAFGKRAHTITRTWSRNPSFAPDGEPEWMSRIRRVKTGEEIVINRDGDEISADKMSAAQLAMIGRGAIGGHMERELRREGTETGSGTTAGEDDASANRTGSLVGLLNRKTEVDLEKAEGSPEDSSEDEKSATRKAREEMDGIEDWEAEEYEDPSGDWAGEDTVEMRLYKAKLAAAREKRKAEERQREQIEQERLRRKKMEEDGEDITEAPMDRDLISGRILPEEEDEACRIDREGQGQWPHAAEGRRSGEGRSGQTGEPSEENTWPRTREWVEGHQLVIEYQKSYSDDPEVQVIELSDEDKEALSQSVSPAHRWAQRHKDDLESYLGEDAHRGYVHPRESARRLLEDGIVTWWNQGKNAEAGRAEETEDTQADRDARAEMYFGVMSWAHERRKEEELSQDDRESTRRESEMIEEGDDEGVVKEEDQRDPLAGPSSSESRPTAAKAVPTKKKIIGPPPSRRARRSDSFQAHGNRSPSPPPVSKPICKGGAGSKTSVGGSARKLTLRKKLLSGELGLIGRRGRSASDDEADEVEEDSPSAPPTQYNAAKKPSVVISAPVDDGNKNPRAYAYGANKPKGSGSGFFPRSSSAGAGLAGSLTSKRNSAKGPFGSGSGTSTPSSSLLQAPLRSQTDDSSTSSHQRSSSIQWLDIADSSHDHKPSQSRKDKEKKASHPEENEPVITGWLAGGSSSERKRHRTQSNTSSVGRERREAVKDNTDPSLHGLMIEKGKSRIANFFTALTAPKGEGMGNPGPNSHP
ncbi:hypothetical protein IE53DRAFT_295345, partial [Violaceomyces palustris]